MTEKNSIIIIYPKIKERERIEICCKNLGCILKYFVSVSEALPHLSDNSVKRVFLDFSTLTDYQYDIPRLESCINSHAQIIVCSKNAFEKFSSVNPSIKAVSEPFTIDLFLKETVGEKHFFSELGEDHLVSHELTVGSSAFANEIQIFCNKYKNKLLPLLICGSLGAGKKFIAKTINDLEKQKKVFQEINLLDFKIAHTCEKLNFIQVVEIIKEKAGLNRNLCLYVKNFQLLDRLNQISFLELFEKKLLKDFQTRQIRIIFSATCTLNKQVIDSFRKNLNGGNLVVPNLNKRSCDIKMLFEYFLKQYTENEKDFIIDKDVYTLLENYDWPSNVRELRLIAAHLSINNNNGIIKISDLPEYMQVKSFIIIHSKVLEETPRPLATFEAYFIIETLKSVNGNISKAARQLGITRNTIKSKLKKVSGLLLEDFIPLKISV